MSKIEIRWASVSDTEQIVELQLRMAMESEQLQLDNDIVRTIAGNLLAGRGKGRNSRRVYGGPGME